MKLLKRSRDEGLCQKSCRFLSPSLSSRQAPTALFRNNLSPPRNTPASSLQRSWNFFPTHATNATSQRGKNATNTTSQRGKNATNTTSQHGKNAIP